MDGGKHSKVRNPSSFRTPKKVQKADFSVFECFFTTPLVYKVGVYKPSLYTLRMKESRFFIRFGPVNMGICP